MSKRSQEQELEEILSVVKRHTAGVNLDDILNTLKPSLPKRTLQRRLAQLKTQNLIFTTGQGRSIRYFSQQSDSTTIDLTAQGYIKLSTDGEKIRQQISQPIQV